MEEQDMRLVHDLWHDIVTYTSANFKMEEQDMRLVHD
jgi:hypothetical protein